MSLTFAERVYWLVSRIPPGQVMTYGDIALALGAPRAARVVGGALRHCPDPEGIPWQRVVNAEGGISPRHPDRQVHLQAWLLQEEGIEIEREGPLHVLDLKRYAWWPDPEDLATLDALAGPPSPLVADDQPFMRRRPSRQRRRRRPAPKSERPSRAGRA
ncbi:MAG: hypothetical protein CL878_09270 [Dehalococcoidia bacterium]|nr:hypothetical protein [Dehalococcoidia bacterium]